MAHTSIRRRMLGSIRLWVARWNVAVRRCRIAVGNCGISKVVIEDQVSTGIRKGKQDMTISQLAKRAGVKTDTIRYYHRIGLLRTPRRPGRGFRSYDEDDASHLRFIRHGQTLGFTLNEVAALLHLTSTDCKEAERIARERLLSVRAKIADLRRLEAALEQTVADCSRRDDYAGCPLIATLFE